MIEGLLASDALGGVEVEKLAEQINREWVRAGEERLERHAWLNGERPDVILSLPDASQREDINYEVNGSAPSGTRRGVGYLLKACRGSARFG